MIYEMTPKAIAAIDQARAMIRDGMDKLEVAKAINIPGEGDTQMLLMLEFLLAVDDAGGRVSMKDEE